ncbi:MAG TPA: FMN-binding glutamate synthase family protein, partial [Ferruginibacter sp.]|nr:FMN-binding glutamate synthase family protein [Ferruginibacter sp.]
MKSKIFSVSGIILFSLFAVNVVILLAALNVSKAWYLVLMLTLPLLLVSVYDRSQKKQSIKRNYPVIGRLRYFFESIRPELRQYFFESDLDGKPFNRRQRSIVYQRAKNEKQTVAFGM